ncbi:HET-domain-containing protein [Xylariaceae sp. FL0255]|nr:HET-domain-containing protein [Xylariaceae sp. FL0255]
MAESLLLPVGSFLCWKYRVAVPSSKLYSRQLNDRDYEVRLLELIPSSGQGSKLPFQCRLVYGSLKDSQAYSALSYNWGDLRNGKNLIVDDVTVQVSENLMLALKRLWEMNRRLIWVDWLCINQRDNEEKSGQVRMMDTIFAKAELVYAWLGSESHDSDMAMAVLGASSASTQIELPEEVEIACDAVIRLFSRPYWTRCWIIQEVCRARHPVIMCGRRYVHWGTMMKRLDGLGTSVPAQYAQHLIAPLRRMRYRDQNRFRADTETGLIPLIVSSRRSLASDPRDKLYALLSLAKDGRMLVPTPNYSQTPETIFIDAARCMVTEHDRTDIMLFAHRTRGPRDLPSWVPDWANLQCEPPPWVLECLNQGRPRLTQAVSNRVSDGVLEVRGYQLDVVEASIDISDFESTGEGSIDAARSRKLVEDLCALFKLSADGNDEEADLGSNLVIQVLRELCSSVNPPSPQMSRLVKWAAHNANRRIGDVTLSQHLDAAWKLIQSQSESNVEHFSDQEALKSTQSALEEGFEKLERLRMVFAATTSGSLYIVHRDAERGDPLYVLTNCPLPVILRPTGSDDGDFKFVGEVFVGQEDQERLGTSTENMAYIRIV